MVYNKAFKSMKEYPHIMHSPDELLDTHKVKFVGPGIIEKLRKKLDDLAGGTPNDASSSAPKKHGTAKKSNGDARSSGASSAVASRKSSAQSQANLSPAGGVPPSQVPALAPPDIFQFCYVGTYLRTSFYSLIKVFALTQTGTESLLNLRITLLSMCMPSLSLDIKFISQPLIITLSSTPFTSLSKTLTELQHIFFLETPKPIPVPLYL